MCVAMEAHMFYSVKIEDMLFCRYTCAWHSSAGKTAFRNQSCTSTPTAMPSLTPTPS